MVDLKRREKGLYWQKAWKLVEGCTKVSPGCDNCWSEQETVMRAWHPNEKINERAIQVVCPNTDDGFNGKITMREDNLDLPLRTRKPTVFAIWNDLFHEGVTDEFRDKAYAVMALCPQHTFLVLTKRSERMEQYWEDSAPRAAWRIQNEMNQRFDFQFCGFRHPLSNVCHGVTVEDQQRADERIPHLMNVPGKRFVSVEPMLGPISLCPIQDRPWKHPWLPHINSVLLGGESGKNARPMHPDWARSVRDQCEAAGVPFFFKQWGEFIPSKLAHDIGLIAGHQLHSFPWGRCNPSMARVGKKKAGRILDGKTHDDLPWVGGENQ